MTNVLNNKKLADMRVLSGYSRAEMGEIANYRLLAACSGYPRTLGEVLLIARGKSSANEEHRNRIHTLAACGYVSVQMKGKGFIRGYVYSLTPMGEVQLDCWFAKWGPLCDIQSKGVGA